MNIEIDLSTFRVGVVGAGSWGTALADLLAVKGLKVDHWVFEPEVLYDIKHYRENKRFLPNIKLSDNLHPCGNLETVVSNKNMVILVTPSHVLRDITVEIAKFLSPKTVLVSASKGIENLTHMTMSGVIKSVIPDLEDSRLAVITGPSFAKEVAKKIPTVVTVAAKNRNLSRLIQYVFATEYFRVYTIDDMIGAELGASIKNVIAIAAGVVDGLGFGLNTRAALMTRGLTEIRRLGLAMGANPRTFTGLAGVGDLILTCTSELSRNYSFGKKIGHGEKLKDSMNEMQMVVEGIKTSKSVYNLSKTVGVEMPISHAIYRVIYDNLNPRRALFSLMTRDLKEELDLN